MTEIDVEQVEATRQSLRNNAVPGATRSREWLGNVANLQTEAHWGVETGPKDFQQTFASFLDDAARRLEVMRVKLEEYERAIDESVRAFEETDSDAAAAQVLLEQKAVAEQRVTEVTAEQDQSSQTQKPGEYAGGEKANGDYGPAAVTVQPGSGGIGSMVVK